jgi:hypothetical protein
MARIRFPPLATHTNPITATDRVPADEQLGKLGYVGGSEETQMTITRREILRRALPAPPSSLPSGGSPRRDSRDLNKTPVLQCTMAKVCKSDDEGTFAGVRGNDQVAP